MVSFVLQTCPLFQTHSGTNIAQVLTEAVAKWELERPKHAIAVVMDDTRNMDVAVREAGLWPHIKCFTHRSGCAPRVSSFRLNQVHHQLFSPQPYCNHCVSIQIKGT